MRILLFNSRANKAKGLSIFSYDDVDKKALAIERNKIALTIKNYFPQCNPDLIVTNIDEKNYVDFDLSMIEDGLRFEALKKHAKL